MVVQVNPATDCLQDLYRIASEAFGGVTVETLNAGFPPRILPKDATKLVDCKMVGPQERVIVCLTDDKAVIKATAKYCKKTMSESKSQESSPKVQVTTIRPKRAAAQVASDSFAGVIKLQDKILKAEKQAAEKPRAAKRKDTTSNSKSSFTNPKPNRKFKTPTPGRRLADGAVVGKSKPPSSSSSALVGQASRSSETTKNNTPSLRADKRKHEDISIALLDSLKNNKGAMGRILRKGLAGQVENSYEMTKAAVRLAALESRTPQTSVQMKLAAQEGRKLYVRFEKGIQGRGYYEETVDCISTDVLKEVIAAIHRSNPEGLRPMNLAFLSKRVLWSLAYDHWETQQKHQQKQEGPTSWQSFSIEASYLKLLPDKDWSFLRRRKTTMSAKAQENLRQQELQENDNVDGHYGDNETAEDAIQDVENSMENLHQYDRQQRASRMANAVLARHLQQQQKGGDSGDAAWKVVTPTEVDVDELKECISVDTTLKSACDIARLAKGLVEWASVRNWREMANKQPAQLHACVIKHEVGKKITQQQVENWIGHAREEAIEEIIVEICNGNTTHVELLRDQGCAGTPKDLAAWKVMPDLLLEELGGDASSKASLSFEDITQYCNRSCRALEQLEWLAWYATPVE